MTDDTRARELLAEELDRDGFFDIAAHIRGGGNQRDPALRAITRALASPQDVGVERSELHGLLASICAEIYSRWDKDQRAGKLLSALAGSLPGYDSRADAIRAALASAPAQPEQEDYRTGFRHGQAYESARIPATQPADEDEVERICEIVWNALGGRLISLGKSETPEGVPADGPDAVSWAEWVQHTGNYPHSLSKTLEPFRTIAHAILASLPTQGRKVREALEGMCEAYAALCEQFGQSHHKTPGSRYSHAIARLSTPLDPPEAVHRSDCAVHNEPPRPCDCHLFDPNIDPPENSATVETVCAYEAGLAEGRVKGLGLAKVAIRDTMPARLAEAIPVVERAIDNLIQSSQRGAGK